MTNANQTADAAIEILARELFVEERALRSTLPDGCGIERRARERWYMGLTDEEREVYRVRARRISGRLSESELGLKWASEGAAQ